VFCGPDRWTVTSGSFVFLPRDSPHSFTVTGTGPARALVITGPARLDGQIAAAPNPCRQACSAEPRTGRIKTFMPNA
jgi:AraC-like ligand binding domain